MMSPLHHAVLFGNSDVIETLASDFGADIRKPVVFRDARLSYPTILLNLVLALYSEDQGSTLAALLKAGASSAQATNGASAARGEGVGSTQANHISALHYIVKHGSLEALRTVFAYDAARAKSVVNNTAILSSYNCPPPATPLISALGTKDGRQVDRVRHLLDHGARAEIVAEDVIRDMMPSVMWQSATQDVLDRLVKQKRQPLAHAVEQDMESGLAVDLIALLLERGANPSLTLPDSYIHRDVDLQIGVNGRTLLDRVRQLIEGCLGALDHQSLPVGHCYRSPYVYPNSVLDEFSPGSYSRASAERFLREQRLAAEKAEGDQKALQESFAATARHNRQRAESSLKHLLRIETMLVDAGAKTYHELYPQTLEGYLAEQGGVPEPFRLSREHRPDRARAAAPDKSPEGDEKPQEPKFDPFQFEIPFLSLGNARAGYIQLFEAAWRGTPEDLGTVRLLTSQPTGEGDGRIPALNISVTDRFGFTALSIALWRGNDAMADLILDIAKEQYEPPESVVQHPEAIVGYQYGESPMCHPTIGDSAAMPNALKCGFSPWVWSVSHEPISVR